MRHLVLTAALALLPALASAEEWPGLDAGDGALEMDLERVANLWTYNEDFEPLAALDWSHAKELYVARPQTPSPGAIDNIVLLSAGQQGASPAVSVSFSNVITGQRSGYRSLFGTFDMSMPLVVEPEGVYSRLVQASRDGTIDLDIGSGGDTYVALIFDAAFYYGDSDELREQKIDAWMEWFEGLVPDPSQVQNVVLGGVSRGGALMNHLGQRLADDTAWCEAKITVLGVDVVVDQEDGEHGSSEATLDNPTLNDDDVHAYTADPMADYPDREGLRVLQMVGGSRVGGQDYARGFASPLARRQDEPSHLQRWAPWKHSYWLNDLDREGFVEDMVDPVLRFLDAALSEDSDDRWRIGFGDSDGMDNFSIVDAGRGDRPADELLFGDFDGDTDTDVLSVVDEEFVFARSYTDSFGDDAEWAEAAPGAEYLVGDFDGDGADDVLSLDGSDWGVLFSPTPETLHAPPLAEGAGEETSYLSSFHGLRFGCSDDEPCWYDAGAKTLGADDVEVGDFTGDGIDDVVHIDHPDWTVYAGTGDRDDPFEVIEVTSVDEDHAIAETWSHNEILAGYFDDDETAEIVHIDTTELTDGEADSGPVTGSAYLTTCRFLPDGDALEVVCDRQGVGSLFDARFGDYEAGERMLVGDVDADDIDDLLVLSDLQINVIKTASDGTFDRPIDHLPPGPHAWHTFASDYGIGDFDRDGRADLFYSR